MKKLRRAWRIFRALPFILQAGAWLALILFPLVVSAQGEFEMVQARVLCDGARVAAIQFVARQAGLVTIRLPPTLCGRST